MNAKSLLLWGPDLGGTAAAWIPAPGKVAGQRRRGSLSVESSQ